MALYIGQQGVSCWPFPVEAKAVGTSCPVTLIVYPPATSRLLATHAQGLQQPMDAFSQAHTIIRLTLIPWPRIGELPGKWIPFQ